MCLHLERSFLTHVSSLSLCRLPHSATRSNRSSTMASPAPPSCLAARRPDAHLTEGKPRDEEVTSGGHALSGRAGTRSGVRLSPAAPVLADVRGPCGRAFPVQCFHQHRSSGTSTAHSLEAVSSSPFSPREDGDCALGGRDGESQCPFSLPNPHTNSRIERGKQRSDRCVTRNSLRAFSLCLFLNRLERDVQSGTGRGCGRVR